MSRNTLLCVFAVLAFGQAVYSQSSSPKTSASLALTSSLGSSGSVTTTTSGSFSASSSASTAASGSTTISGSASGSPSTSTSAPSNTASPSSSPSATTNMSPSPSPKVSSSNSVSQSATKSGSASFTPSLSSVFKSLTPSQHSSSPVSSISTSHASLVSPSPTAVVATESVNIKDDKNETCLQAQLEVTFDIKYAVKGKTKKESARIPLNGNSKTLNVSGNCSYETGLAYFKMKWNEHGNTTIAQHTFTMNFVLLNKTWIVPNVSATFSTSDRKAFVEEAVKSTITASANSTKMFGSMKKGKNYLCDAESTLKMSDNVAAVFKNVVLQPFSNETTLNTTGTHCSADHSEPSDDDSNTVPIAVGAALGGLVLIVLVAYIIGRRRSNRGYEQV